MNGFMIGEVALKPRCIPRPCGTMSGGGWSSDPTTASNYRRYPEDAVRGYGSFSARKRWDSL